MGHVYSVIYNWNNSNVVFGSSTGGEAEFSGHKEKVKVNLKPEIGGDGKISTASVLTPYRPPASTNSTKIGRRDVGYMSIRSALSLDRPHVALESRWLDGEYTRKSNSTSLSSRSYLHPIPSSANFDVWVRELEDEQAPDHREELLNQVGIVAGVILLLVLVGLFSVVVRRWCKDRKSGSSKKKKKERRRASGAEREGEGWIVEVDIEAGGRGWVTVPL